MDNDDSFNEYIKEQSRIAIEEADLIIFLVEYDDVTPDDSKLAEIIRKSGKENLLVVNKVDNDKRENYISQHYELNLGDPLPISILTGKNIETLFDIIDTKIPQIEAHHHEEVSEPKIRVSIVGKPNTGKSSLLNFLMKENRSIVSDIPGTTRDSIEGEIEHKGNQILIVDTAGLRKKNRVKEDIEFYSTRRAIQSVEYSDVAILMIDAVDNLTDQDKKISGISMQRNKGMVIAVNKWDLIAHEYKNFSAYEDYLRFKFSIAAYIPVVNISVLKGQNIYKLLDTVVKVYKQYNQRIDTGEFNRFLQDIVQAYPPKIKRGKFKIYYGTQISAAPIKFVLFCNNPKNCPTQYVSYITNRIREKYGFEGIPIDIKLKGREQGN
jgi:GTP-binding protein